MTKLSLVGRANDAKVFGGLSYLRPSPISGTCGTSARHREEHPTVLGKQDCNGCLEVTVGKRRPPDGKYAAIAQKCGGIGVSALYENTLGSVQFGPSLKGRWGQFVATQKLFSRLLRTLSNSVRTAV